MYYYIYLKLNNLDDLYINQIANTIDRYFGKVIKKIKNNYSFELIVKDQLNKDKLHEYFENFLLENLLKSKIYISKNFNNEIELEKERSVIALIFENNKFINKHNVYDFKTLLNDSLISNNNINIKKYVLGRFYNNNEYETLLKKFFNNNLNILKTSRDLNMHRNTVIYRLESFFKETNFDPRNFNDAFIIKILIDY